MKKDYSQSVNNWFRDYPRTFILNCGPNITEFGGPWVNGSKIYMVQTPLSKIHQDIYREGTHLPDYQIIYTDNGLDTGWKIKYLEYGWGTFTQNLTDANYWLTVEKTCELWSGYNGIVKIFKKSKVLYTDIPKTSTPVGPQTPDIDPVPFTTNYNGEEPFRSLGGTKLPIELTASELSFFLGGFLRYYGKYAEPEVQFSWGDLIELEIYQIALTSLLVGWRDNPTTDWPYLFGYAGADYETWQTKVYYAPDRAGFYMPFVDFLLTGDPNDLDKYIIINTWYPIYYIQKITHRGTDVTRAMRRAYINSPLISPGTH